MSRLDRSPNDDWRAREAQRRRARGQQPAEPVDITFNLNLDLGDISRHYERMLDERRVAARNAREAAKQAERNEPTFSECVIGYRQWHVDALDQLWPVTVAQRPWEPGINVAVCARQAMSAGQFYVTINTFSGQAIDVPEVAPPQNHKAPHKDCECGLYAWRRLDATWRQRAHLAHLKQHMPRVVGAVAFWGDVRIHRQGFRAEKACVVTLAHHDDERPEVVAVLERVARRYRVDLVPFGDLEVAASRHGTPLPDSLQPPRVPSPADLLSPAVYTQWLMYGSGGSGP